MYKPSFSELNNLQAQTNKADSLSVGQKLQISQELTNIQMNLSPLQNNSIFQPQNTFDSFRLQQIENDLALDRAKQAYNSFK